MPPSRLHVLFVFLMALTIVLLLSLSLCQLFPRQTSLNTKTAYPFTDPYPYQAQRNEVNSCQKYHEQLKLTYESLESFPNVGILLGIMNDPRNFYRRAHLRRLLMKQLKESKICDLYTIKFVVLFNETNSQLSRKQLEKEKEQYDDIIIIETSATSMNPVKTTTEFYRWAIEKINTSSTQATEWNYLVHTEDTSSIDLHNFGLYLRPLPKSNFFCDISVPAHEDFWLATGRFSIFSTDNIR
ncbi:12638_t:CDS:1 [Ambispora gerdemannii]|uniref:12638_t:CDS:1 n=1 Tax=Ambispora gerdemannii TaxID=144530 RepID=A0A9N8WEU3_9GLOM|nr:12638_t:CDS:1 [Ambispora gerdemannii]